MMTNLFSIFDPSTPNFLSSNWLSSSLFLLLMPMTMWAAPSYFSSPFKMISNYLFLEFKPLMTNSPYGLLMTCSFFMFIMVSNTMGLLPFVFTATSHMSTALSMIMPYWLGVMLYYLLVNTSSYLTHLIPKGTPLALMPFMVLIETTSVLIRPITLAIRLTANMIAGHLLLSLLSASFSLAPFFSLPFLAFPLMALTVLEIAVALIQAYVFSILLSLYAAEAVN